MKRIKRIIAICLAVVMVFTICPQQVQAASYTISSYGPLETCTCYSSTGWLSLIQGSSKAKITKVKIANKSLASVEATEDKRGIRVYPKKAGTTTLKVTVKNGNKSKTHSLKLKVYDYKNPASSFKIDGKQYKSKFTNGISYSTSKPKKSKNIKLDVKAKKGYQITSMNYTYYKADGSTVSKALNNGKNFKLYNKRGWVTVTFRNKSTGYSYSLYVHYY